MFSNCAWTEPRRKEYGNHNFCLQVNGCWSPCMWYTDLKHGSYACLAYTLLLHFLGLCYTVAIMGGDRSAEFYSPFFEFDGTGMFIATSLMLLYMLIFFAACGLLGWGLHTENRILFWPWMLFMAIEIIIMIAVGLAILGIYWMYYYVSIFVTIVLYIFCGFHFYNLLCVSTHFRLLGNAFKVDILYPDYNEWP